MGIVFSTSNVAALLLLVLLLLFLLPSSSCSQQLQQQVPLVHTPARTSAAATNTASTIFDYCCFTVPSRHLPHSTALTNPTGQWQFLGSASSPDRGIAGFTVEVVCGVRALGCCCHPLTPPAPNPPPLQYQARVCKVDK